MKKTIAVIFIGLLLLFLVFPRPGIEDRIDDLESEVSDLRLQISYLEDLIYDLESQISDLDSRLTYLEW